MSDKRKEIPDDTESSRTVKITKNAQLYPTIIRSPLKLHITHPKPIALPNPHNLKTFNNTPEEVFHGTARKDDFDNWIYNIDEPITVALPVNIRCDFNDIQLLKLDKLPCKKLICIGVFNKTTKPSDNFKSILKFDFSHTIVLQSVESAFIKFLADHIDIKSLHYISLPTLNNESFLTAIEWIKTADSLIGFDYIPKKHERMQSCLIDTIQKNIELKSRLTMTPVYSPTSSDSKQIESINLKAVSKSIVTYNSDQNMFEISRNLKYKVIELRMDQLKSIKYPLTEIKEFRFVKDYSHVAVELKIDTADFSCMRLHSTKVTEFLAFLAKQRISHLVLPRLDEIDFKEVYESIMKIRDLNSVRIHESNYVDKLKDLEDVLNTDICSRNHRNRIEAIKTKNGINSM